MPSLDTALSLTSAFTSIVGTAMDVAGQKKQADAAERTAAYQAGVLMANQIAATRAAEDARLRGAQAAQRQRKGTRQLIGKQRAVLASNGVMVDSGSALDIVSETAGLGEEDALQMLFNSEREALDYERQGRQAGTDATMAISTGSAISRATSLNSVGTLIGGAGAVAERWYNYRKEG